MNQSGQKTPSSTEEQAGPEPCQGGCGFYGQKGRNGYCSVCYEQFVPEAEREKAKKEAETKQPNTANTENNTNSTTNSSNSTTNTSANTNSNTSSTGTSTGTNTKNTENTENSKSGDKKTEKKVQKKKHRCWQCRKKMTLAGSFECKCGYIYCAVHRYPDSHECDHNYQKDHKNKLEKAMPAIVPSKLERI